MSPSTGTSVALPRVVLARMVGGGGDVADAPVDQRVCEACGEQISLKRIQARRVAELCIDCKAEQEQLERRNA